MNGLDLIGTMNMNGVLATVTNMRSQLQTTDETCEKSIDQILSGKYLFFYFYLDILFLT